LQETFGRLAIRSAYRSPEVNASVEGFYQRVLAGDPDETPERAELLLKERSLSSYYDEVALKGLQLAAADALGGVLALPQIERIRVSVAELVEDLSSHADEEPTGQEEKNGPGDASLFERRGPRQPLPGSIDSRAEGLAGAWGTEQPGLCIAGREAVDEAASLMLARRHSAVVSADLAGFVRLMEQDEMGTLRRLLALQHGLLVPVAARCGGRLVTASGDGFLLEFGRVGDAVRWALAVQACLAAQEREAAPGRRFSLRIGVHWAEVIVAGGDIYGDAVNVAARLQRLTAPGEVWITQAGFEQLQAQCALSFDYLGQRRVKNRRLPLAIWRSPPRDAVAA
jgi:class 3 adenylate cyclase